MKMYSVLLSYNMGESCHRVRVDIGAANSRDAKKRVAGCMHGEPRRLMRAIADSNARTIQHAKDSGRYITVDAVTYRAAVNKGFTGLVMHGKRAVDGVALDAMTRAVLDLSPVAVAHIIIDGIAWEVI